MRPSGSTELEASKVTGSPRTGSTGKNENAAVGRWLVWELGVRTSNCVKAVATSPWGAIPCTAAWASASNASGSSPRAGKFCAKPSGPSASGRSEAMIWTNSVPAGGVTTRL